MGKRDRRVGKPLFGWPRGREGPDLPKIHEDVSEPDEEDKTRTTTPVPQFEKEQRTDDDR